MMQLTPLAPWSIACGASGDLIVDYHPDTSLGPYVQVDVPHTSHASLACKPASRTSQHHLMMFCCRRSCHSLWQSMRIRSDSCTTSTWRSASTLRHAMLRQQARDVLAMAAVQPRVSSNSNEAMADLCVQCWLEVRQSDAQT